MTLGITEREFWRLQPIDINERAAVFFRQQDTQKELAAWVVHHVMSALVGSKHAPTVDRLMGRVTDA